ncbi:MAG: DEAD/DEAH box helicase, partial [Fulvivirga sp.]|nr:DEAD/DEAH box helicase [Fulvivirga sp.]
LDQLGFTDPTPIQKQAIPLLLSENPTDFIGLAQTGTGKTAAFGLPLIDLIDESNKATQALIMAPTRELGKQTAQQLVDFVRNRKSLNIEVVYGGAAITNQIKALKKPTQIVVATPGRLLDLIKRKAIQLDQVRYVVLDEADEMLNMGFKEDIDKILSYTQDERVTWLFSATMPGEIRKIVKKYMRSPHEVTINAAEKSNKDIAHQYTVTKTDNKIPALRRFLDIQPEMRGILFCRTKRETQQIADSLSEQGYGAEPLHGDLSQSQRDAAMRRFKQKSMQLLVATDVAARGIDVDDLTHVMHHTLPDQLESYTHRSGRTGRAGKKGISLAFINPREGRKIKALEKKINVTFEKVEVPGVENLKSSRIHHWASIINNTKVDPQVDKILPEVAEYFAGLSKEDLLKRLITTQLDHIMVQNEDGEDLNESQQFKEKDAGQKGKKGKNQRFFINIGTMDGVTKADLIHFIADVADVNRNQISDLVLQKSCAYFDLEGTGVNHIEEAFEGIMVEGRSIRVNPDDTGPKAKNAQKGRKRSKKRSGRRRNKKSW